ncbi:MAG: D-glycero-beta-D-manno-heptose 1-phosphate adenylyltransferase [Syntrophobacteraceae bacterium]
MKARLKIKSLEELKTICDAVRSRDGKIVFTNGCFDLLHVGHVRYLEEARGLADALIVAVNTDASVMRIKGPLRPIVPETDRAELVASLQCVDYVTLFDTPDPLPLIRCLLPDFLVKGADWPIEEIVGAEEVLRAGGQVVTIDLVADRSTSGLIEKIAERFGKNPK